MSLTTNKEVWKIMGVITLLLTIVVALCLYFRSIFVIIIIGLGLILITEKLVQDHKASMDKKKYAPRMRKLATIAVIVFWCVAILLLVSSSVEGLIEGIARIASNDASVLLSLREDVNPYLPELFAERILTEDLVRNIEISIISFMSDVASKLSFLFFNSILIIPILFYMYFSKRDRIVKQVFNLVPKRFHQSTINAMQKMGAELHDFFSAKMMESLIVGLICCLGFYVAGLPGWLLLGIIAGFLNIVPYVGPLLGLIPAIFMAFSNDVLTIGLVIATIIIAQLIDNLYLIPFMIAGKVKLEPLINILLILIGAQLFGVIGMVFAVPIYLIYKIVLKESYHELVKIYD